MNALLITLICLLPLASLAEPTTEQVVNVLRWRVIQITGTDDRDAKSVVVDASGVNWSWKLTNACPTAAYIEANAATARAYLADYDRTEKAAIKEVSPEVLKAVVAAVIKTVNKRLLPAERITAEEMTAAIKEALP